MKTKFHSLLAVACLVLSTALLYSCGNKEIFDQAAYNKMLSESFPVQNIDANQTWKTVSTCTANIIVNEDAGTYTIRVYDAMPLANDTTYLLAKGTVENGKTWTSSIDYPATDTLLYVSCTDAQNREEVRPIKISNNAITTTFGTKISSSTSRVLSRAATDEYGITIMAVPYTDTQINTMLSVADDVSSVKGGDVANYGKNANNYYKITGVYNGALLAGNPKPGTKVIVSGTWNVKSDFTIQTGLEVIIANGGKINLSSSRTFTIVNPSRALTILKGGELSGNGVVSVNSSATVYNGGTISMQSGDMAYSSSGTFYNAAVATMDIGNLTLNSNSVLINYGTCTVKGNVPNYNSYVYNACKLTVEGNLVISKMIIGSSASVVCKNLYVNGNIYLNSNALLSVSNYTYLQQSTAIVGPSDGSTYAICELSKVSSTWAITYFYYDLNVGLSAYSWGWPYRVISGEQVSFVNSGYAKLNIPAYECTIGYTTKATGVPRKDSNNFGYTYCFEDNYPYAGDYDFNDLVMYIERSLSDNVVTLKVTLKAVGAGKQLGAALRLYGISPSQITSVTTDNAFNASWGLLMPQASANGYLNSTDSKSSVIIPLFNDAHYAMSGSTVRAFYNTASDGQTVATKTLTITINAASYNDATLINSGTIDPFIIYASNASHLEVHTFPWKDIPAYASTSAGTSGVYTWAIQVPKNFHYPKEYSPINTVYPNFSSWAQNMNTYQNWYDTYDSTLIWQ